MAEFVTPEAARERFRALADQVDAVYAEMRALSSDGVGNELRTELAERLEFQERTNRGLMYRVFAEMADPPDEAAMAPVLVNSVAARLRIPPREVKRRMKTAGRIRPRRQLCGPPLAPELELVAAAVEAGAIGEDHLRVISRAIDRLPSCVSVTDRGDVERSLVREATKNDAEIVKAVAGRIDEIFNPDGDYDEADRARRRGLALGAQGPDGMSRLSGFIDPETRSYVEAVTAAVRPGRHLPDGTIAEVPDERSGAQRCHDGIKLGLKAGIASGEMGSHRGHPVTVIVRTTLAELNQAAHAVTNPDIPMPPPARTGGDTALPMRDVIRMAAEGIHYLVVFDATVTDPSTWDASAASPRLISASSATPATVAAPAPTARNRAITARSTTAQTGPPAAPPTPTPCSSPASQITLWSPTVTTKPASPTPAASPGPTARNHPKSTTPTTPKNSCAATPTHPTTNRSSRHQRQGQPHGCQNGLPYPPP
jgi:hypothetical protein